MHAMLGSRCMFACAAMDQSINEASVDVSAMCEALPICSQGISSCSLGGRSEG